MTDDKTAKTPKMQLADAWRKIAGDTHGALAPSGIEFDEHGMPRPSDELEISGECRFEILESPATLVIPDVFETLLGAIARTDAAPGFAWRCICGLHELDDNFVDDRRYGLGASAAAWAREFEIATIDRLPRLEQLDERDAPLMIDRAEWLERRMAVSAKISPTIAGELKKLESPTVAPGIVAHAGGIFRERQCVAATAWALADRIANMRADELSSAESRVAQIQDQHAVLDVAGLRHELEAAQAQRDAARVAYEVACEHEQACDETMRRTARELAREAGI
jgi:hypothetical protein